MGYTRWSVDDDAHPVVQHDLFLGMDDAARPVGRYGPVRSRWMTIGDW